MSDLESLEQRFQAFYRSRKFDHQISLADPTLDLGGGTQIGWYSGGESAPIQKEVPKFIKYFAGKIGAKRRVYVGGSAGGYAALLSAWHDPGSVCVVYNPQVNLMKYNKFSLHKFMDIAWPGVTQIEDLRKNIITNVAKLYLRRFNSTVIYIQNNSDNLHVKNHLSEFARVGFANNSKFILDCSYWGVPGHSGSVPKKVHENWVSAALSSKRFDRDEILDNYFRNKELT